MSSVFRRIFAFLTAVIVMLSLSVSVFSAGAGTTLSQRDFDKFPYITFYDYLYGTPSNYVLSHNIAPNSLSTRDGGALDIHFLSNAFYPYYPSSIGNVSPLNYGIYSAFVYFELPFDSFLEGDYVKSSFRIDIDTSVPSNFLPTMVYVNISEADSPFNTSYLYDPVSIEKDTVIATGTDPYGVPYENYFLTPNQSNRIDNVLTSATFEIDESFYTTLKDPVLCFNFYTAVKQRNFDEYMQFTDTLNFEVTVFDFRTNVSISESAYLGNKIDTLDSSLEQIDSSLQGKPNETFDDSTAKDLEDTESSLLDGFGNAFSDTGVYFDDAYNMFNSASVDGRFNVRAMRFVGTMFTELLERFSFGRKAVYVSLSFGFLTSLIGIGFSLSKSHSKGDKGSTSGKSKGDTSKKG